MLSGLRSCSDSCGLYSCLLCLAFPSLPPPAGHATSFGGTRPPGIWGWRARWSPSAVATSLCSITLDGQFHFLFLFVIVVTRAFRGLLSAKLKIFFGLERFWRIFRVENLQKPCPFLVEMILLLCTVQLLLSGGISLLSSLLFRFSGGVSRVLRQKHCRWIPPPLSFLLQNPEPGSRPPPPLPPEA